MIVSIFVEQIKDSGIYNQLDLFQDENIFLNFKYKDSKDIAKAFSTYSQSFSIPASSDNILALNYEFSTELLFNRPDYINAKVFINSKLFKVGFVKVVQIKYKGLQASTIQLDFFTSLTNLKDIVGEALIGSLTSTVVDMGWTDDNVFSRLTNNGDVVVPLISTNRYLTYLDSTSNSSDICWHNTTTLFPKAIWKNELRPAIRLGVIIDAIIDQYDLDIECPLFTDPAYSKLYAWCNGDPAQFKFSVPFTMDVSTIPFVLDIGDIAATFRITANTTTDIFTVSRVVDDGKDTDGFTVQILSHEAHTGVVCNFKFIDQRAGHVGELLFEVNNKIFTTYPGGGGYSHFTFATFPITNNMVSVANPLAFSVVAEFTEQITSDRVMFFVDEFTVGVMTRWISDNNTITSAKGRTDNLFKMLPEIKIIDFLSSLFKMFNLSVLEDNESHKLTWLTPQGFYAAGFEIDYTPYGDIADLIVKKQDKFGKYTFQHKDPNYSSSVAFKKANVNNPNQKLFGQVIYDTANPYNKAEYKLETNFSIAVPRMVDGTNVETYYGFNDTPLTLETANSLNYYEGKPVTDAFTIFYNNGVRNITGDTLFFTTYLSASFGYYSTTTNSTRELTQVNQFKLVNGTDTTYTNAITFKDEVEQDPTRYLTGETSGWTYDKNLFSNYYYGTIQNLIHPRIFLYQWNVILPTYEMQRFSLTNTVVIGNRRYKVEEAQLNLIDGKCSMLLSNIID